jgi:hypothetical protein
MKRIFMAVALAAFLATSVQTSAFAKTPPEVVKPYKAYQAAMKSGDLEAALSSAYEAWQAAEATLGDHKSTGDLAQNYGDLNTTDKKARKRQVEALRRAQELSRFYEDDAPAMYMQRGITLSQKLSSRSKGASARKVVDDLIEYAEANEMSRSIFMAEALTIKAGTHSADRNGKKTVAAADRAIDIFKAPGDDYESYYPAFAYLYKGFGHEYEEETMPALLAYQELIKTADPNIYKSDNLAARALGRWIFMRTKLTVGEGVEPEDIEGLCSCYPFDVVRNETVKPIKRTPPEYPKAGLRLNNSGYSIVRFDLNDDGSVKDPVILTSWPPDIFEASSLKSLDGWEYSARAEGETDEDRQNIVATIRYVLADSQGRPIY